MGKQPGVMLYFDIRPCLKRLTGEEKGALFEAILNYGEYGAVPELEGMTGVAWDFIQPRLDRDRERYEEVAQKRAEAANARWSKQHANASGAVQAMPATPSTPNTKTASSSSPAPAAASTPPDFNHLRNEAIKRLESYQNTR